MKYTLHHLLLLMVVVGLLIHGAGLLRQRRDLKSLEGMRAHYLEKYEEFQATAIPLDDRAELCRQVVASYHYPNDFAAIEQRYQQLQQQRLHQEKGPRDSQSP